MKVHSIIIPSPKNKNKNQKAHIWHSSRSIQCTGNFYFVLFLDCQDVLLFPSLGKVSPVKTLQERSSRCRLRSTWKSGPDYDVCVLVQGWRSEYFYARPSPVEPPGLALCFRTILRGLFLTPWASVTLVSPIQTWPLEGYCYSFLPEAPATSAALLQVTSHSETQTCSLCKSSVANMLGNP